MSEKRKPAPARIDLEKVLLDPREGIAVRLKAVEKDISWIKQTIARMGTRQWAIITGIVITILLTILIAILITLVLR